MALAALGPEGFRGQRVQIPEADLPAVKRKVLAAWKQTHKGEDLPEILKQHGGLGMTQEELAKKLTDLETDLSKANQRADRLEHLSKLDEEDHAAFDTLPEAEQEAYFKADAAAQTDILAKAKDAIAKKEDPTEDDTVAKVADIQKRLDDVQKQLGEEVTKRQAAEAVAKQERDAREMQEFTKRAETEFAQLPGTPVEKAQVLKSLQKLTTEERAAVEKLFQSGNACLASGMRARGTDAVGKSGDAWDTIQKKAEGMVTAGTAKTLPEAIAKVCEGEPELYTRYLDQQPSRNVRE
jgi:vacuolar-type H+-ATPase subunit I/STV1